MFCLTIRRVFLEIRIAEAILEGWSSIKTMSAACAVGLASMQAAIFADVGVMILAVLNASRALKTEAACRHSQQSGICDYCGNDCGAQLCAVEGCALSGVHTHNGVSYCHSGSRWGDWGLMPQSRLPTLF